MLNGAKLGLDWTGLDWTGLDWTGLDWHNYTLSKINMIIEAYSVG